MPDQRRFLISVLLLAATLRIAYAAASWTPYFKNPDVGIGRRALEGSYGIAADLGYVHARRNTPADRDTDRLVEAGESGARIDHRSGESISRDGMDVDMLYPPGWPLLGAALHRATGQPISRLMQGVGILVDTAGVWFLFRILIEVGASVRLVRGTTIAYALFPPLANVAVQLYAMSVMSGLILAVTWLVVLAAKTSNGRRYALLVAAGAVVGFASYFRSDFLLCGVFFGAALWWIDSLKQGLIAAVAITATALAALLPWAYRNHQICGDWIFTSAAPGAVLVTGLGAYPNPWGLRGTDEHREEQARAVGIQDPFGSEANRFFREQFIEYVRANPAAYARILATRCVEAIAASHDWGIVPPADAPRGSELRQSGNFTNRMGDIVRAHWPKLISVAIILLGDLGCIIMFIKDYRQRPLILLPLAVPLYAALSHIPTHMMPQYLLPGVAFQLWGLIYLLTRSWRSLEGRSIAVTAPVRESPMHS